ncbi:transporter [Algibacter mikhailovii]|uniref:Transporter n=1 Tax=Algibacter mikhailovii TaxID=425498 RepID=A0A918VCM1_9FLAO|nr:hypothetical protein [Algibacter mikhailovii]GGZ89437.1 hypothetical protein GCM10007028_29640 [Algibacter mikhailovii]
MKNVLILLVLSVSINAFAQGAWTQKTGEAYTQLSFSTIGNYSSIYGNPNYETEREITDNTLQLYGEYGLNNKTTLILNIPLKFIETGNLVSTTTPVTIASSNTSLGNIVVGIKRQFYNKKWVISGQLNLEANSGSFENESGIRTGIDAWSFTPTLNAGRSFKWFYAQAFTGVAFRTNDYSSSFKIGGEIGIRPIKRILVIGLIDVVKSFENGDVVLPPSNLLTGLYVNNQEYAAYSLKFVGEITNKLGVNIGIGGAFSGNNVARRQALTFGAYHKF